MRSQRWLGSKSRVKKLWQLKNTGARRVGQVYTTGTVSAATYGADVTGLPTEAVRQIRAMRLRLDGKYITGACTNEQIALETAAFDPGILPHMAPLMRYHREVWLNQFGEYAPKDLLNVKELNEAFGTAVKHANLGAWDQGGPIALAIKAAKEVGWDFINAFTLKDAKGSVTSLWEGSPTQLKKTKICESMA